jgi:hypothetical protein
LQVQGQEMTPSVLFCFLYLQNTLLSRPNAAYMTL